WGGLPGRRLPAADVLEYGAAVAVVATGAVWRGDGAQPGYPDPMAGADPDLRHVLAPEQVCAGKRPPGRRVVVYDTDGYYVAPGVAEMLAADGYEVTVVTTFEALSPVSDQTLEGDMLRAHLHGAGVSVRPATTITAVGAGSVMGHGGHGQPWSADCDGVVLVTQQTSTDSLYPELAGGQAALAAPRGGGRVPGGGAAAPPPILSH